MNKSALKVLYVLLGLLACLAILVGYSSWSDSQKPKCDNPKIKGNISLTTHEKIYHNPGDKSYDRTLITPVTGERMFCSEQDARDAGWRHAQTN